MPRGDGTGPQGKGSMTGRGLGPCNKTKDTNNKNIGSGLGLGRGLGRGQGKGLGKGLGIINPKNK